MLDFFPEKPWACKCGCGFKDISPGLIDRLNVARFIAGTPFYINSACRCIKHNAEVGGAAKSGHLKGMAADVACDSSIDRHKIIDAAIKAGFKKIGIAKTFIHLDDSYKHPTTTPIIYLY